LFSFEEFVLFDVEGSISALICWVSVFFFGIRDESIIGLILDRSDLFGISYGQRKRRLLSSTGMLFFSSLKGTLLS
jgi:hypothetical protein